MTSHGANTSGGIRQSRPGLTGKRSAVAVHLGVPPHRGGKREAQPSELGVRITYLATPPVINDVSVPDCDFAVPLRRRMRPGCAPATYAAR